MKTEIKEENKLSYGALLAAKNNLVGSVRRHKEQINSLQTQLALYKAAIDEIRQKFTVTNEVIDLLLKEETKQCEACTGTGDCPECDSSGECLACGGEGKDGSGNPCPACDGEGDCQECCTTATCISCDGTGKVDIDE